MMTHKPNYHWKFYMAYAQLHFLLVSFTHLLSADWNIIPKIVFYMCCIVYNTRSIICIFWMRKALFVMTHSNWCEHKVYLKFQWNCLHIHKIIFIDTYIDRMLNVDDDDGKQKSDVENEFIRMVKAASQIFHHTNIKLLCMNSTYFRSNKKAVSRKNFFFHFSNV